MPCQWQHIRNSAASVLKINWMCHSLNNYDIGTSHHHKQCCNSLLFCCSSSIRDYIYVLKEANSMMSLHSLRQSDPNQWFVAATWTTVLPPHSHALFGGLGLVSSVWRWWQQEEEATWPWQELMRLPWAMTLQSCMAGESEKGGLPGIHCHDFSSAEQSGSTPVRTGNLTTDIHNSSDLNGSMGSWAISFVVSGTPTTPSGVRFMARKDICQAVCSSPVGFHWGDEHSLQEKKYNLRDNQLTNRDSNLLILCNVPLHYCSAY